MNSSINNHVIDVSTRLRKFKEENFPPESSKQSIQRPLIEKLKFILCSVYDVLHIYIQFNIFPKSIKHTSIVYTAPNFCTHGKSGNSKDRITHGVCGDKVIYINYSKESLLRKIDGNRVINTGGVAKLLMLTIFRSKEKVIAASLAYRMVNDLYLKKLQGNDVYTLCHYDYNGWALIASRYRFSFKLIEVQHGSMINYPPYQKATKIPIPSAFYVKNTRTSEYLKVHFCKHNNADYFLLPLHARNSELIDSTRILYISSLECNGLHSVVVEFLKHFPPSETEIFIRLHPRERNKEGYFRNQLKQLGINGTFDQSDNWIDGNKVAKLFVITPWSSVVEEAIELDYPVIIIDPGGKKRFQHLIDDEKCFYAATPKEINKVVMAYHE